MKKNNILFAVLGVLLIIAIGVTFAYFTTGIVITGTGSKASGTPAKLINVTYDAGTSALNAVDLSPGKSASKTFTITVTPGSDTNTATYAIKLNITSNTFEYCTSSNYNTLSNACTIDAEELIYTLKDSSGTAIATGNITGISGELVLVTETKTVDSSTAYSYTLEITFKNTEADQNHNINKTLTGNVKVEFAEAE